MSSAGPVATMARSGSALELAGSLALGEEDGRATLTYEFLLRKLAVAPCGGRLTNGKFVTLVYQNVLNRASGSPGSPSGSVRSTVEPSPEAG